MIASGSTRPEGGSPTASWEQLPGIRGGPTRSLAGRASAHTVDHVFQCFQRVDQQFVTDHEWRQQAHDIAAHAAGQQDQALQNGGFTVFGQVTAQSQETLDKIAALVHCSQVPLVGVTKEQCSDENLIISNENLVSIQSVVVLDDDPNSAQNLTPKENTLIDNVEVTPPKTSDSSGSMAWLLGALLLVAPRLKRAK